MRIAIAGQGVSFELGDDWRVEPPWDDALVQRDHGMNLRHVSLGAELHLRGWSLGTPDPRGMLALIAEQRWPLPRFDEETRAEHGIHWAAATWEAPPWIVREWFLTDGRSIANAALLGRNRTAVRAAADAANQLLLTARFTPE